MPNKPELRIDWATYSAARYACRHWHYSGCLPVGKLVKVGAWEDGRFVGVVVFGRGATPNLGRPYGLKQTECVELVRIALRDHASPVTRIVAIAIRMLRQLCPGLRLIVSFADASQGHHGGIYQAGNWIYTGAGSPATFYRVKGRIMHPRSIGAAGYVQNLDGARKLDPNAEAVEVPGKHRYLMPLDQDMVEQVMPLSKPYPSRRKGQASEDPSGLGGSTPTPALQ